MNTEILVAILSLCGTGIGSGMGILTANKLTNYRIEQLEKKVDKHNHLVERMTHAEDKLIEIEEDVKDLKQKG